MDYAQTFTMTPAWRRFTNSLLQKPNQVRNAQSLGPFTHLSISQEDFCFMLFLEDFIAFRCFLLSCDWWAGIYSLNDFLRIISKVKKLPVLSNLVTQHSSPKRGHRSKNLRHQELLVPYRSESTHIIRKVLYCSLERCLWGNHLNIILREKGMKIEILEWGRILIHRKLCTLNGKSRLTLR